MNERTTEQEAALMLHQQQIPDEGLNIIEELAAAIRNTPEETWPIAVGNIGWIVNIFYKHCNPELDEQYRTNLAWAFAELIREKLGAAN
jgi:hypothetical protein